MPTPQSFLRRHTGSQHHKRSHFKLRGEIGPFFWGLFSGWVSSVFHGNPKSLFHSFHTYTWLTGFGITALVLKAERVRYPRSRRDCLAALQGRRTRITVEGLAAHVGKIKKNKANGPADCLVTEMLQCLPMEYELRGHTLV